MFYESYKLLTCIRENLKIRLVKRNDREKLKF